MICKTSQVLWQVWCHWWQLILSSWLAASSLMSCLNIITIAHHVCACSKMSRVIGQLRGSIDSETTELFSQKSSQQCRGRQSNLCLETGQDNLTFPSPHVTLADGAHKQTQKQTETYKCRTRRARAHTHFLTQTYFVFFSHFNSQRESSRTAPHKKSSRDFCPKQQLKPNTDSLTEQISKA